MIAAAPAAAAASTGGRRRAVREAGLLLGLACLLATGAWLARPPRLPLRADVSSYQLDLGFPLLTPQAALAFYQAGEHLFLDTRNVDPDRVARIPGAFAVREATFADDLLAVHAFLTPAERVILYGDGNLLVTAAVAARLRQRGYQDVSLLQGDLAAWERAGGPVSAGDAGHE